MIHHTPTLYQYSLITTRNFKLIAKLFLAAVATTGSDEKELAMWTEDTANTPNPTNGAMLKSSIMSTSSIMEDWAFADAMMLMAARSMNEAGGGVLNFIFCSCTGT